MTTSSPFLAASHSLTLQRVSSEPEATLLPQRGFLHVGESDVDSHPLELVMKSILARGLRRAATALNNVAERLEPSKERIQAAQEAAQAAIDRARRATVETIAEIRSEAQETAQRGQEYAATSPVKAKLYVALVFSWAVLEGFAWMALFTFLFGSTAGFIASVIWSFCNIEACGRRGNALASYVFGLFTPRMEVCRA